PGDDRGVRVASAGLARRAEVHLLLEAEIMDEFPRKAFLSFRALADEPQEFPEFRRADLVHVALDQIEAAEHGIERREQFVGPLRVDLALAALGQRLDLLA